MSSYETSGATETGFLISSREWKVVGGASALMALNVFLMYVIVMTPLVAVNDYLFGTAALLGAVVYGAAIMGGELLAEKGVKGGDVGIAFVGMVILQLAFGVFGAGVLSWAPREAHLTLLVVTAVVTAAMTALIGTYVYARSKTFENWGSYANYAFVGGLVALGIGFFVTPVLLVGFVLIFLGFVLRLGWEIWKVRDRRDASVALQTIGVYIAVAGVFVHVLQLVMRVLARR